jgi:hypothetical protein
MEVHGPPPFYGYDKNFFTQYPEYTPAGTWSIFENKGLSDVGGNKQATMKKKVFVVMPSAEAALMFNAFYIKKYNGNYARWFSTDPIKQELYRKKIESIRPRLTDQIK